MNRKKPKADVCKGCKKPTSLIYKEIEGDKVSCINMCNDCPLKQKLIPPDSKDQINMSCICCETSFTHIKTEGFIGCEECYQRFGKELKAIVSMEPLSEFQDPNKSNPQEMMILKKALEAAIENELYEEAARLRDLIKTAKEGTCLENSPLS